MRLREIEHNSENIGEQIQRNRTRHGILTFLRTLDQIGLIQYDLNTKDLTKNIQEAAIMQMTGVILFFSKNIILPKI